MRESSEWTEKYFTYWEEIIFHHVPEAEGVLPKDFEPRTQQPLNPEHPNFGSEFVQDVRNCAEILQKHVCRNVCHKYGHTNECRFLFPHEYVPKSYFDEITNSVVMKCLDGNVNYYNCHLLTSTCHNHDIKNILSGKSAKAAMFYITDYITKNDEKLHQVLALLSCAVAATPTATEDMSPKDHAQLLILKCLTAMMRNQWIHGQQAARYLRNTGDTIPSHKTKPMLSHTVMHYITKCYKPQSMPPAQESPHPRMLFPPNRMTLISKLVKQMKMMKVTLMPQIQMRKKAALGILSQSISSFIEGRMASFTNAPNLMITYIVTSCLPMCLSMILSDTSEKRKKGGLSRRKMANINTSFSFSSIKNITYTCFWKQLEKPMITQSMMLFQEWWVFQSHIMNLILSTISYSCLLIFVHFLLTMISILKVAIWRLSLIQIHSVF